MNPDTPPDIFARNTGKPRGHRYIEHMDALVPNTEQQFAVSLSVEDWASVVVTLAQSSSVTAEVKGRITSTIYNCAERST